MSAEVLDERWTRPEPPAAIERALPGPDDRAGGQARQVPAARPRRPLHAAHAPADDGQPAARRARRRRAAPGDGSPVPGADDAAAPARGAGARRRPAAALHRPAPLRARVAAVRGGARPLPGLPDRGRAARRGPDPRLHRADRGGPDGSPEVVPAGSEGDRGHRQHLRGRGAASGGAAPALAGRLDASRALGGAARGDRRGARGGAAQRRRLDRRLPRLARRAGLDAGRVPRPHARGPGVPALRRARSRGSSSPAARPTSAPPVRRDCGGAGERGSGPRDDPRCPRVRGRPLDRRGGPAAPSSCRRPARGPGSTSAAAARALARPRSSARSPTRRRRPRCCSPVAAPTGSPPPTA